MRDWQGDDCNFYTGCPWRSRTRVRKEWAGGGGRGGVRWGVETWQSRIIPKVYKRELPWQVRWMRQQSVLQRASTPRYM